VPPVVVSVGFEVVKPGSAEPAGMQRLIIRGDPGIRKGAVIEYNGEQYVCCLLTTTPRRAAVELDEDDWKAGGTPEKSYVNPWVPMSLDHDAAINRQGALRPWVVDGVAAEVARYVGVEPTQ
jgi:hypothetical protein